MTRWIATPNGLYEIGKGEGVRGPITKEELYKLPSGTRILVYFSGSGRVHDYVLRWYNGLPLAWKPRWGEGFKGNIIDFVEAKHPSTMVWVLDDEELEFGKKDNEGR